MISVLLTALAGGFGAASRYGLDLALARRLPHPWLRLMVINISGSALLGLVTGLAASQLVPVGIATIIGAGFLGGYTTLSAASLATLRLVEERRWDASLASSLGMLFTATLAASVGVMIGLSL